MPRAFLPDNYSRPASPDFPGHIFLGCVFIFYLYRAIVVIRTATFSRLIGVARILGIFSLYMPCQEDILFLVMLILSATKAHREKD